MSYLAVKNKVLFSEYPFTIKDVFSGLAGNHLFPAKKILGLHPRITEIKTSPGFNVHLFNAPPILPSAFLSNDKLFYSTLRINASIISRSLHKSMDRLHFQKPIIINAFNPFIGLNMLGKFNECLHVYYCYDAINDARNKQRGLEVENRFCSLVDGVITSSDELYRSKSNYNPNTFVVKNGVEFEVFNQVVDLENPVKNDRIRIGFIGSIDFRFDFDLFLWLTEQLPDYEFLVVGRNANDIVYNRLATIKNVTLRKPVRPDEVPQLMYSCNAGLIPLTRIPINKNVYPMKINEYLSVGLPVVMTDFADLPEFRDVVSVASTKEEFLKKLVNEIENDAVSKKQARITLARNNSWAARAEEFSDAITKILERKTQKEK
jgi:glycosyltransferase involved in cell wall biosynthesis